MTSARRERYLELRRQGLSKWEAAAEMGGLDMRGAVRNWEMWFEAEQRGEHIVPGGRWTTGPEAKRAGTP